MNTLTWILFQFVVCAALILWSGVRLSRYGDMIAEKTGLGGTWIGLLLMAGVTSLPELITGGSAIVLYDLPDIAAGDAIGSCMFNLLILAMLDVRDPAPLSARIHQGHTLTAAFGILQLGLVSLAIHAGSEAPAIGWIGLHSLAFIALYATAVRTIFVFERRRLADIAEALAGREHYGTVSAQRAALLYASTATVLVAAATYLPGLGEQLAEQTGLTGTFVGSAFIAAATSLPEVVVSIAAVQMGAMDMAAANLFGSNLFNVAVLGVDDLLYTRGTLLTVVSPAHLMTLTGAILMTATAIIGLTFRASRKSYRMSWDTLAMVTIYVVVLVMLRGA